MYAVGVAVTVTVALVVAYAVLTDQLRSAATQDLHDRLGVLAAAVGAGDETALLRDPYAQLLGPDGVTAHSPAAPGTPVLTPQEQEATIRGRVTVRRPAPGLGGNGLLAAQRAAGQVVVVGTSLSAVSRAADRILLEFAILGPLLVVLLALGVRRLVNSALTPVAALTTEAAGVSAANVASRLPVPPGDDEIAELARTLNGMLDRLAAAQERERTFVDDAAHELRTPIAVLRAELELGLVSADPAAARRSLTKALAEADRLGRLATGLLALARARSGQLPLDRHPTDVTAVVREWSARVGRVTGLSAHVTGPELVADLDAARLEEVVTNLLDNAAAAGAGRAELRLAPHPDGGIELLVSDDGPGFPADALPSAFARFGGSRPAAAGGAQGAGLGLAIVEAIARAHGGAVEAGNDSSLGGAWVRVVLPAPARSRRRGQDRRTRGSSTA